MGIAWVQHVIGKILPLPNARQLRAPESRGGGGGTLL